ncbi:hypothetical protein F5Y12DRAFT_743080 [Xylaria sp. FL1777]|nr:hypothetical protein F5Y12DRAFT_743080 [Xylaria sp. FL1777]
MHKPRKEFSVTIPNLAGLWKGRSLKALGSLCSLKIFRKPTLPLKVTISLALLMPLAYYYSWFSLETLEISFGIRSFTYSTSNSDSDSNAGENVTQSSVTDGLRMVVFGGGDIGTPTLSASGWNDQPYAWTEIMCRKLRCDTYLSFIPKIDGMGGAVMSNQFLDAAYTRVSASTISSNSDENTVKLDYSWATEQYPKPYQHDLAAQVDSFLSSPRSQRPSTESLWVFNVGYWDIWYLAALPRKLATEVLDSSIRDLFFQIERLYQATQDRESVAFAPSYSEPGASTPTKTGSRADGSTRAPFRIFLTRLFDISLTPGFESIRPSPPKPHSSTTQLRNAAFLTKYWNALLDVAVNDWLATSGPEDWPVTDKIDIKVIEALAGKRLLAGVGQPKEGKQDTDHYGQGSKERYGGISLPRRRFASYGISSYLRDLMIDRQLRNADLFDHNGLGVRPPEDGFLDISMPCVLKVAGDRGSEEGEVVDAQGGTVVCQDPDNYLFYTEFTVSPRAIHEIGVRAARRFLDQVEVDSAWRERAMMYKENERERKGHEMV